MFSKKVKLYRGENAAYHFIESILKEVNYCNEIASKEFNAPLWITKEEKEDFKM